MKKDTWLERTARDEASLASILKNMLIGGLVIGAIVAGIGIVHLIIPDQTAALGTFGDFVGGSLNPVLTFITFGALILTVLLQQRELTLARNEFKRTAEALERENFEATFFRLSTLVQETARFISIDNKTGLDAFRHLHNYMRSNYNNTLDSQETYEIAYDTYGFAFGHYFRVLHNALRFLDNKKRASSASQAEEGRPPIELDVYVKILRAQLSDFELAVLYYNALSNRGRKLQQYLETFAIFDNLDEKYLLHPDDRSKMSGSAWGEQSSKT
ncbi:hypothetical protein EON80_25660 [bacterium]|nr:MAG: hypothetical protein EON80_25660 [bacterium]